MQIEREVAKTGMPILKVNNMYLHSKYDPEKEAERFAELQFQQNYLHILFGFGEGYIAEALRKKMTDNENILIIDPLKAELDEEKMSTFIVVENIENIGNIALLSKEISESNRRVKVIASPNYDKIFENEYLQVLKEIKDRLRLNQVNENTMRAFAESWQKNYLYNLLHAVNDYSLERLNQITDAPVVIASGGPSLTKQLPLLKKLKDKIVIIAAGSTINTLLKHDIEPDYVVSIDGSEANFNHYKDIKTSSIQFMYTFTSHYGIRDSFDSQCFVFGAPEKSKMNIHYEKITEKEIPLVFGGGSVANFCFSIANYITSGPIALIGQDLAYTNNQSHAAHNKNFKELTEEDIERRGMFKVEGYYGDEVVTDFPFLSMIESFEGLRTIVADKLDIYNCTEGGALIKGYENKSFDQFCQEYCDVTIDKSKLIFGDVDENKTEQLIQSLENELVEYKRITKLLRRTIELLNANKNKTTFDQAILKKLDKQDEKLKALFELVSINTIVDPITTAVKNHFLPKDVETAKEIFGRVFDQNMTLYKGLLAAVEITVQFTKEVIAIAKENKL